MEFASIISIVVYLEFLALLVYVVFRRFTPAERVEKIQPFVRAISVITFSVTALVVIGKDIEISAWVFRAAIAILIIAAAIGKPARKRDRSTPTRIPRTALAPRPATPARPQRTAAAPRARRTTNQVAAVQVNQPVPQYVNQPLHVADQDDQNVPPPQVTIDPDGGLP